MRTLPITIPLESVASALSGFPVYLDMSDFPSEFWDFLVYDDGRDIRVIDDGDNDLPFDIVYIHPSLEKGSMFVKVDLSNVSDTTIYITFGVAGLSAVPVTDPNGRNAVWSAYHRVLFFDTFDNYADHTGNSALDVVSGQLGCNIATAISGNILSHEGAVFDGTYYYCTDVNYIRKYDTSWNLIASNNDPCGDIGDGSNHLGDLEILDGVLYIPSEIYTNPTTYSLQKISKFNASDLSYIGSVDISAQGHEAAGICYVSEDHEFIMVGYALADNDTLWRYDADDLSYIGAISLVGTVDRMQGITYWRGSFFVTSAPFVDPTYTKNLVIKIDKDGTVRYSVCPGPTATFGHNIEGIYHTDDNLFFLFSTGGPGQGIIYRVDKVEYGAGSGAYFPNILTAAGQLNYARIPATRYSAWSMGMSFRITSKAAIRMGFSYAKAGNEWQKIENCGYRLSTNQIGAWNTTDGWVFSAAAPAINTTYRLNLTHNGTVERKLYTDGVVSTDSGCTSFPAVDANCFYIGANIEPPDQQMMGYVGFIYLRNGILSADWILAESDNLSSPSTFYGVGDLVPIAYTLDLLDSITLTDLFSYGWQFYLNLSDIITLDDSIFKLTNKSLSDVITLSDALIKLFAMARNDSITLADAIYKILPPLNLADIIHLNEKIYKGVSKPISDVILMHEEIEFSALPLIPGPGLIFDWTNGYPRRAFPIIPFTYQYEKPHYNEAESISDKAISPWKTPDLFAHMRITPTHNPWCGYWYVGVSGSSGPKPDGSSQPHPWPWNPPTFPHTQPPAPLTPFPTTAPPVTCHCDEDISYTTPHMFVGETQDILVIDPNECCVYSWTLEGEGDLDTSDPLHVIYTAPGELEGCDFQPIIRLFCGLEMCAEIHINVTNPLPWIAGYGAYCKKYITAHSYGGGYVCYDCDAQIVERHLYCDGTYGYSESGCSAGASDSICTPGSCLDLWPDLCEETSLNCWPAPSFCAAGLADGCIPYGESYSAPWPHDTRTEAQKLLGCCPPQLI